MPLFRSFGTIVKFKELLQEFIDQVENGNIKLYFDRIFQINEVAIAHQYMEDNRAKGKIIVKT